MLRRAFALLVLGVLGLAARPADAQWFSNFMDESHRAYNRNMAWPDPFLRADREAVIQPFATQVANGWRRQNLLSDYHFNEDNPQLNAAGEARVYYILTQMPPNRRTIFVQRSMNPDITATRMAIVQRTASRMMPMGQLADVVESDLDNGGWPAEAVDRSTRSFQTSAPAPVLPKNNSNGGGGGGGGGN